MKKKVNTIAQDDALYFDMDDTLYGLSALDDWLPRLRANDAKVYSDGKPCHDLVKLAAFVNSLQEKGTRIGIISWLSMCKDVVLYRESRKEKKRFLQVEMGSVVWDELHITAYGRKKHLTANYPKGVLVDDKDSIREEWEQHGGVAIDPRGITTDELIEKIRSALPSSLPS